jgi:transposase-like protein
MQRQGISLAEAARRLGVSQSVLYLAMQKGQIATLKTDRRTVISSGALREYQIREYLTSDYRL